MYKSTGSLNERELGALDEVKVVAPGRQSAQDAPSLGVKPAVRARRAGHHHLFIIVAMALILAGVALGVSFGNFQGGSIAVDELTALSITLNVNSTPRQVLTNAATVGELLTEQKIKLGADDYIGVALDQPLTEGMDIWLRLSVEIAIKADGQTYLLSSQPITTRQALEEAGITLGEQDQVSRPLLQYIYTDSEINVYRVRTQSETVEEPIAQPVVEKEFTYLTPGSSEMITPGREGVRTSTYDVTYRDGVEIARRLLSSEVTREPVEAVQGYGPSTVSVTAPVGEDGATQLLTATTENGGSFYYKKSYMIEATAYTWTGNKTATGTWPQIGTIAVDPDYIPLGATVYVVGYGFATAEDTGGAIQGNIIDLYMDAEQDCINWGRRNVVIYIISD